MKIALLRSHHVIDRRQISKTPAVEQLINLLRPLSDSISYEHVSVTKDARTALNLLPTSKERLYIPFQRSISYEHVNTSSE